MLDGRLLNERYRVKQTIGGGGMANVYLARDIILDRDVAVKVLRLEYANDEEFIARFHREAHSAASLSHPNIVNIYDVGEEDGIYYMVMEYVDGMTLKKYIQTYGSVEEVEALEIMKQITSAISHAHSHDIVHRDIKPQNILIDSYGKVKVTDFGIAVALSATSLTQTNSVLGSVHYLSPEQARGGMANKKSDIYSLGIVLFELLTGRLPFWGQSAVSIALKHLQSETPSLRRWIPDIPQSVENIVLKATAKDPFHRYETVYDMEDDLESALDPGRLNEERFVPPEDEGEETKAIPVITDAAMKHAVTGDTLIHDAKEESSPVEKGKKQKRKKLVMVLSLLTFVLLGTAFVLFLLPVLLGPDEVEMIDVTGMEYEEAYSELMALSLKVNRETVYSDEIPEGRIIRTDPEEGEMVQENAEVTIYSSRGKERVAFSDYVGRDFEQVKRILEGRGYRNIIEYSVFSEQPEGEIITQIQPVPGAEVVPEETNVIFEISRGPETVTLRSFTGMTAEEAKSYLTSNSFEVTTVTRNSDEVPAGEVISQTPPAYTQVELESEVELVISTGPKERPVIRTVTFMVPYTAGTAESLGQETAKENAETKEAPPPFSEEETEQATPETGSVQQSVRPEQSEQPEEQSEQPEQPVQLVKIYVEDMNNDLTEVFRQESIREDTEFTINLTIPPGGEGIYKVVRGEEVILEQSVPYEEKEGD